MTSTTGQVQSPGLRPKVSRVYFYNHVIAQGGIRIASALRLRDDDKEKWKAPVKVGKGELAPPKLTMQPMDVKTIM